MAYILGELKFRIRLFSVSKERRQFLQTLPSSVTSADTSLALYSTLPPAVFIRLTLTAAARGGGREKGRDLGSCWDHGGGGFRPEEEEEERVRRQ